MIEILLLILAIPAGFLIAYLARDELIVGRKWFRIIIILGLIAGTWFYITGERVVSLSSWFMGIIALVSLIKSNDKRWTKKKV